MTLNLPIGPLKNQLWGGVSTEMRTQYLPGTFLFKDALNTFCLRSYGGVGHMIKDHSDSERKAAVATTWATTFSD